MIFQNHLKTINSKFDGKKSEFVRKKECIYKCECYSCKAVGVYKCIILNVMNVIKDMDMKAIILKFIK